MGDCVHGDTVQSHRQFAGDLTPVPSCHPCFATPVWNQHRCRRFETYAHVIPPYASCVTGKGVPLGVKVEATAKKKAQLRVHTKMLTTAMSKVLTAYTHVPVSYSRDRILGPHRTFGAHDTCCVELDLWQGTRHNFSAKIGASHPTLHVLHL